MAHLFISALNQTIPHQMNTSMKEGMYACAFDNIMHVHYYFIPITF
jgi:hypothetical protein